MAGVSRRCKGGIRSAVNESAQPFALTTSALALSACVARRQARHISLLIISRLHKTALVGGAGLEALVEEAE